MTGYTAGELKRMYYVPEVTYGTTPTAALTYGGAILRMTPKVNMAMERHWLGDTQGYTQVTRGPYKAGYELEYYAHVDSGAYYWYNFAAVYGLGAAAAFADHLGSFTTQFMKYVNPTYYYDFYNGCKINQLDLLFNKPGQPIVFKADVKSQFLTLGTSKTMTGLQNGVVVGANPTDIATNLLCRNGISQINLGAGGLVNWYPKTMALSIPRNLEPVEGVKLGADSVNYPLEVLQLDEGQREVTLTCDIRYGNTTYKAAKLAGTAITALTIPIGNQLITLANGDFAADDFPEERQAIRDEPLKMHFKALTISTP